MANLSLISPPAESSTIRIRACALALALISLFILPQVSVAQSRSATNAMTDSPVTTGIQKATRQVAEMRDKQAVSAKIPMNGMLYITPEPRYTVESSKTDPNLRIMFQAAEGIIINHVGTKPGQAKLVLRLVDGRTVTVNASAAKNKTAASYLIIR